MKNCLKRSLLAGLKFVPLEYPHVINAHRYSFDSQYQNLSSLLFKHQMKVQAVSKPLSRANIPPYQKIEPNIAAEAIDGRPSNGQAMGSSLRELFQSS